jgi:cytochrome c peroxidase
MHFDSAAEGGRARAFAIAISFALPSAAFAQGGLIGTPPDLSNWPHPAAPVGNPFPRSTATPQEIAQRDAAVRLGKALFWDEQVSVDNTMSCGTCHLTERGGTDSRPGALFTGGGINNGNFGAFGVIPQAKDGNGRIAYGFTNPPSSQFDRLVTPVFTPTMIGAYLFNNQFWDMRAGPGFSQNDLPGAPDHPNFTANASLEDQAVGPPISDVEMGHQGIQWTDNLLQAKLGNARPLALVDPATVPPDILPLVTSGANYRRHFDAVFSGHPQFGGLVGVTRERFAMAIAHYERTLLPDQAPIDLGTMTPSQLAGFNLMKPPRANCFTCHSNSGNPTIDPLTGRLTDPFDNLFSDGRFHQIGINTTSPARKTTTLRNVGLHTKFFSTGHGGTGLPGEKIFVTNFDELITFYDNQPGFLGFNGTLTPAERAQVRDFLENALTDPRVLSRQFPFDRPELASERPDFDPFEGNEYGSGTPGGSGLVSEIIANAPPHVPGPSPSIAANNWFKVGVGNAPANAPIALLISASAGPGPVLWVGQPFVSVSGGTTNAQGIGTVFTPFPLTSSSVGVPVFTQWMVADGPARAFSDAAKFVPFAF